MSNPDIMAALESIKKCQETYSKCQETYSRLEDLFKQIDGPLTCRLDQDDKYSGYGGWSFPESVDLVVGLIHAQSNRNAVLDAKKQYETAMRAVKKCNALASSSKWKQSKLFDNYRNYIGLLKNASQSLEQAHDALIDERKNLGELLPKNPDMTKENERKDLIEKHKVWETTKAAMNRGIYELRHKRDQVDGRKELIELKLSEFGIYCKNASV